MIFDTRDNQGYHPRNATSPTPSLCPCPNIGDPNPHPPPPITLLPLLPLPLPLLPSPLQPHLPLRSIKLLPRLLQLPIHLQQLLHPPQHLGALPDRKQEIIDLHLLTPRVVRRVRSDVARLDDEVGDDLIEDTDGFGEGGFVVAEGVEEGFHCDEGMLAQVEGR